MNQTGEFIELAGYHNVRLSWKYGVQQITDLRIEQRVNHHARMVLSGILSEEQGERVIDSSDAGESVAVHQITDDGSVLRTLFQGQVLTRTVRMVRGIYYVTLEAVSWTYELDVQIKSRSFHPADVSYEELIERVIENYKGADVIDTASEAAPLEAFTLQYKETDWFFLKRMASRFGTVLVPEVTADAPKIFFGLPEGRLRELDRHIPYRRKKILHGQEGLNGNPAIGENMITPVTIYSIELEYYCSLGDRLRLPDGAVTVVIEAVSEMKQGLLLHTYQLCLEENAAWSCQENPLAAGAVIAATVCGVDRDHVQLKLDLDEKHDTTTDGCWFPYMTTYVAEGHTGWYSMPDLGEHVQLYLPSAREAEAVVRGALRSRDPGRKPEAKAWHNKQGNGFDLVANELRLHAGSGMVIRLDEQSGVKIRSSGSIAIRGGSFSAQAGQRWNMEAGEAIYLRGGESSLVLDGESDLRSGLLTQEGSVKAPVHVTDLEPVPEPPLMTVEAYTAAQEAKTQASSVSPINGAQIGKMMAAALSVLGMIPIASTTGRLAQSSLGTLAMMPVASGSTGPSIINAVIRGMKNAHLTNEEKELNRQMYGEFTFLLGKVFTGAKGLREPQTKETLVNFLIHFSRSVEIGASRIPDEVWETNNRLNRLIERFQAIDTLHLPNQLRKQGMRDILFGRITDPEHYNAWEDNRLSLEDKIMIAKDLEKQFHDEPNVRQLNFFFVRERTTYDIPPGFRIGMPKFIKSAISPLKIVNGKLRVWTGDKFFEYKVGQKMVKESFKNGIQGIRNTLEKMADNNNYGLKVAPAGGYIYSNKSTVKKPSELTKTQKNYWNVMESNSGKMPQGKGGAGGTGNDQEKLKQKLLEKRASSNIKKPESRLKTFTEAEKEIANHKVEMKKIIDDEGNFNLSNGILNGGKINESQLKSWVPPGSKNGFRPDPGVIDNGFKYNFIYNGKKVEVKWHSPQLDLSSKLSPAELATSNSYNGWSAQIKIGKKYLGTDGNLYRNNKQNITHIPVILGR